MFTAKDILQELESLGTAQNRKIYARHGVGENMYGVSYANLDKLKKRLKTNQELAEALWASGNHDARILATKIADPKTISEAQLDTWMRDLKNHVLVDAYVDVASKTAFAREKTEQWLHSEDEFIGRAGWHMLGQLAMHDTALPDDYFEPYLAMIERDIYAKKNRTREAMNNAMIAIGARSPALREKAVAAAARLGKIEIDHGDTDCKTPYAVDYIEKAWTRKKK